MTTRWRLLILAAALIAVPGVRAARAQTVVVTNAAPGAKVEVVLNTTPAGSAQAGADGYATVVARPPAASAKKEIDANVHVDSCGGAWRVLVVERGTLPPEPEAGCARSQIPGLFLVRPVSTLAVNVSAKPPTLLLRQGRFNPAEANVQRNWPPAPTGLVLSGGLGFATFRDAAAFACGDVTTCSGSDSGFAYQASVAWWFARFAAAEVGYVRPSEAEITGSQENAFRFNSFLDAHVLTLGGKAGVPIGPARIYGHGGATRHWATSGTTQTNDARPVTIDGVTTTIEGGTQTLELKTAGWGWYVGGGVELWLKPSFGLYLDAGRSLLKGDALEDADGRLDDALTQVMIGARVKLGK